MAKTPHSKCRGPGSIPGQGTRSHMQQLKRYYVLQLKRSHMSQLKDPTCRNEDRRSHVPQLRPGAVYGVAQSWTRLKRLSSSSRDDILLNVLGGTFLDSPCSPLHFPRLDEMLFLWALRLSYVYLSHRNGPFLIQYLPMAFWKADCTLELWIIRTLHGPWHVIGAPCMFIE